MADAPKKKKEWWDFGDTQRKPSTLPAGKGTPEQQRQGLIMLVKVQDGMKNAIGTHPSKVIENMKAMNALRRMSTDFPWPEGYGGEKWAKLADIALAVYKGNSEAMKRLSEAGYDYAKLEAKYGKLFPEGATAPKPKPEEEPEAEEPEEKPAPEKKPEEGEEKTGEGAGAPVESKGLPAVDDDIQAIFG